MKFFTLFSVFFILSVAAAKAQVNPLDTLGFRMSVASEVKDIALVTGMTSAKQLTLAAFLQQAEDTITGAVNSGVAGRDIAAMQNQLVVQFQSILSAQELVAYRQQRKDSIYARVLTAGN